MSSEVRIEIEDKPTTVTIMRELVEHLQDTIEALKREVVRNPSGIPSFFEVPRNKRIKMGGKPFRKESKGGHNTGMSA
jgi:hypothetical protein